MITSPQYACIGRAFNVSIASCRCKCRQTQTQKQTVGGEVTSMVLCNPRLIIACGTPYGGVPRIRRLAASACKCRLTSVTSHTKASQLTLCMSYKKKALGRGENAVSRQAPPSPVLPCHHKQRSHRLITRKRTLLIQYSLLDCLKEIRGISSP